MANTRTSWVSALFTNFPFYIHSALSRSWNWGSNFLMHSSFRSSFLSQFPRTNSHKFPLKLRRSSSKSLTEKNSVTCGSWGAKSFNLSTHPIEGVSLLKSRHFPFQLYPKLFFPLSFLFSFFFTFFLIVKMIKSLRNIAQTAKHFAKKAKKFFLENLVGNPSSLPPNFPLSPLFFIFVFSSESSSAEKVKKYLNLFNFLSTS